ncbi:phage tail sheath C-terminal domain-containing protein [Flavobacterium sp.]|uniref:phage tail sheath C-terminal domain-containing protein n=1 Tax=Flavobacterium sp. TaxID=239 RepID=UPI0039E2265E
MNVSSLKTPGVYINEIDAFPPSVAPVATAIPAFVGFTQKGPDVPTRITSFLQFEQVFGGAPAPASITVNLDGNNMPLDTSSVGESQFKLYNSMRLFYANGGGICYIVSIGNYGGSIDDQGPFLAGLTKLRKFDEPTLLLFPDAINLPANLLGLVQQDALKQCGDLMDRFAILDVKQEGSIFDDSASFRDKVSNMNLKYGAAYYPYLQSSFPYQFRFSDINGTAAGKVNFKAIYATDIPLKTAIEDFEKVAANNKTLADAWDGAASAKTIAVPIDTHNKLKAAIDKHWTLLKVLGKPDAFNSVRFSDYSKELVSNVLKKYAQSLVDFKKAYEILRKGDDSDVVDPLNDLPADNLFTATWGTLSTYVESVPNPYTDNISSIITPDAPGVPYQVPDFSKIQLAVQKLHASVINAMDGAVNALNDLMLFEESNLISRMPLYEAIVAKLSQTMNTLPPSGAMAGIYAQTDNTRGVWISPANKGIIGIIGLTADINDSDQEDMNVSDTGKSINALRKFAGKGFMVWGGRTLAGNSTDWRYVNVRRLANMIEESTKKACMQYVFEPNVSQTWISVKGMIDNFLTTLWNSGALAGSKPEHAFFVQVGLNETMSSQDVLDGKMIVKIGYAPSRPAEFIILEFKQTQQRS